MSLQYCYSCIADCQIISMLLNIALPLMPRRWTVIISMLSYRPTIWWDWNSLQLTAAPNYLTTYMWNSVWLIAVNCLLYNVVTAELYKSYFHNIINCVVTLCRSGPPVFTVTIVDRQERFWTPGLAAPHTTPGWENYQQPEIEWRVDVVNIRLRWLSC